MINKENDTWGKIILLTNSLVTIFILTFIFQFILAFYLFVSEKAVDLKLFGFDFIRTIVKDGVRLELGFIPNVIMTPLILILLSWPLLKIIKTLKK